jgi:hypothetical protein
MDMAGGAAVVVLVGRMPSWLTARRWKMAGFGEA